MNITHATAEANLGALAALGVALASLSQRQQLGSASELAAAKAYQAALAGLDWGSYQILRAGEGCAGTSNWSNQPADVVGRAARASLSIAVQSSTKHLRCEPDRLPDQMISGPHNALRRSLGLAQITGRENRLTPQRL